MSELPPLNKPATDPKPTGTENTPDPVAPVIPQPNANSKPAIGTPAPPIEPVATPEPVVTAPIDYQKLIADAEANNKLEIEKAKLEAINASKESTIDRNVMASILEQQQQATNDMLAKVQKASDEKMEELRKQIANPRSVPITENPNDDTTLSPEEEAKKQWENWSNKERADYFINNARSIKIQYDVHPYGTQKKQ